MVTKELEKERRKLNQLVKKEASKEDILKQSQKVDKLINQYYGVA